LSSAALRIGLTTLATTLVAVGLFLWYARKRRFVDVPNERSSHTTPTPRSGGVGIAVGALAAVALHARDFEDGYLKIVALMFAVTALVGFVDDLRGMDPIEKLIALVFIALPFSFLYRLDVVRDVPFAGDLEFPAWAAFAGALVCLSLYPSAFNFMDGVDGIASLTAAVSGAAFVVAGREHGDRSLALWGAVAVGASLGFLPWNFPKARIFMGDAGSLPLGFLLILCAGMAARSDALPLPASILLLGPFVFDVAFTLVRRTSQGKRLGEAHKEHLYQRLSRVWGSHAKVSLLYAGFSVVTGALALAYAGMSEWGKLLSLAVPTLTMLGFAALVLRWERAGGR
jgi:UDP-N-acetylmuramyl pentapeptide phosphotransferase/UDP-N-acetylglucosamine-1-phosphate transferase